MMSRLKTKFYPSDDTEDHLPRKYFCQKKVKSVIWTGSVYSVDVFTLYTRVYIHNTLCQNNFCNFIFCCKTCFQFPSSLVSSSVTVSYKVNYANVYT